MLQHLTRSAAADEIFFTALSNAHAVRAACAMALYAPRSVYNWRRDEPAFAARWAIAKQMAGDLLEEEADRRGRDGIEVPVLHRGKQTGTKRKFSDRLLFARLQAERPAHYRAGKLAPASPPQAIAVETRDLVLEDLLRRVLRGEAIDRTTLPLRVQGLIGKPNNESGQ
jgi:hypothetical protein